jgi:hypothetical protein
MNKDPHTNNPERILSKALIDLDEISMELGRITSNLDCVSRGIKEITEQWIVDGIYLDVEALERVHRDLSKVLDFMGLKYPASKI